jgi:hypothetical protein
MTKALEFLALIAWAFCAASLPAIVYALVN